MFNKNAHLGILPVRYFLYRHIGCMYVFVCYVAFYVCILYNIYDMTSLSQEGWFIIC